MATGLNLYVGVGHLGEDSELRYTQPGTPVMSFQIACGERYKDRKSGKWEERTEWVPIALFGKRAEGLSKMLLKGSRVLVTGKYHSHSYQDSDGKTRYSTEIRATDIIPLSIKGRQVADEDVVAAAVTGAVEASVTEEVVESE